MSKGFLTIKCSPQAREKCPFDLRCKSEEDAYFEEGSACDKFNKKLNPPPPPTNGDRIRAMSDEVMAKELLPLFEELCEDGVPGDDYMLWWLKQTYKEEA